MQFFIKREGGQHVLSEPIQGFGRFAWVIPYGIGASGLLLMGVAAIRWSRRSHDAEQASGGALAGAGPLNPDDSLNARLDDELRDLD